ncbi:unnamed protein product [Paramecium octaurelia]|uniref:Uncharacterized protein n=1 Tax=Paramecium octaurelia TaxID=43137 RepID=A0A8S1TIG0_PAROT|nr:unnamed protein product [Paramecium octaurelia]
MEEQKTKKEIKSKLEKNVVNLILGQTLWNLDEDSQRQKRQQTILKETLILFTTEI